MSVFEFMLLVFIVYPNKLISREFVIPYGLIFKFCPALIQLALINNDSFSYITDILIGFTVAFINFLFISTGIVRSELAVIIFNPSFGIARVIWVGYVEIAVKYPVHYHGMTAAGIAANGNVLRFTGQLYGISKKLPG